MKKGLKWVVIIILVLVVIAVIFSDDSEETETTDDIRLDYAIVETEKNHLENAQRYSYHIVIKESASINELQDVIREITEKAKSDYDFNALWLGLYDYEEYIGSGVTLGKVEYAPYGEWSRASEVRPGSYRSFEFNWDLREKDWEQQLDQEELKIWASFDELLWEEIDKSNQEIYNMVAEEFNISSEKVKEIVSKQMKWTSMDLSEE